MRKVPSEAVVRPWPLVLASSEFNLLNEVALLKRKLEVESAFVEEKRKKAEKQGFESAKREFEEHNVKSVFDKISYRESEIAKIKSEIYEKLPSLVAELTVQAVGKAVKTDNSALISRIETVLKTVPSSSLLELKVHPSRISVLTSFIEALSVRFPHTSVLLTASENLNETDVLIRTEDGVFDCGMDTLKAETERFLTDL